MGLGVGIFFGGTPFWVRKGIPKGKTHMLGGSLMLRTRLSCFHRIDVQKRPEPANLIEALQNAVAAASNPIGG